MTPPPDLFGSPAARTALCREAEGHVATALRTMGRARLLVQADRTDAIPLLVARRVRLAAHFQRYQRFKHGSIFDPVIRHGAASSRVVARSMKVDCLELGEVFAAYHGRWLGLRAPEWGCYRADMLATVDLLGTHLQAELRAMRQLLQISGLYGDTRAREPAGAPAAPAMLRA